MPDLSYELQIVAVKDVVLDPENPRFLFQTENTGRPLTEEEMENTILEDDETKTLMKALSREGVKDPVWLKKDGDGKHYVVIEGNRRITALRELARQHKAGKLKIDNTEYLTHVPANIYKSKITEKEALLQRARLQTGKAGWGRFNEAAVAYKLRHEMYVAIEDIAAELQISKREVSKRLEAYERFKRFVGHTKIDKPSYFSLVSDLPRKAYAWVNQDPANEKEYFDWLAEGKVTSTSTRGGLRELPLVLDDSEALSVLRQKGKTMTEAINVVEAKRVELQMPLLKRIQSAEDALRNITVEELGQIKSDPKKIEVLEALRERVVDVLSKSGR